MDESDAAALTRSTARLGVATTLAVAIPPALAVMRGDGDALLGHAPTWWAAYLTFVVVLVANVEEWPRRWTATGDRVALALMMVTGLAAVAVAPSYGFTVVLTIVTASAATFIIGLRPSVALVVVQAVAIGVAYLVHPGISTGDALLQAAVWAGFMGFAVLTVEAAAREGRARDRLALANAELATANDRLERANAELEDAQRQLAVSSRNAERLRISRDLHDLIGHQLTALTLQLEAASHRDPGPATDNVERSRAIARDLLGDVRDVVGRLRDDTGPNTGPSTRSNTRSSLVPDLASRSYGDATAIGTSFGDVTSIGTSFYADEPVDLPVDLPAELQLAAAGVEPLQVHLTVDLPTPPPGPEASVAVLRIVQEVMTNTVRHAEAEHLWIEVASRDGGVVVMAHDDGRGAAEVVPGNGLVGMQERLAPLGGTVRARTSPGEGFHLEAAIPGLGDPP